MNIIKIQNDDANILKIAAFMAREFKTKSETEWLATMSIAIQEKRLSSYFEHTESVSIQFAYGAIEIPKPDAKRNPDASTFWQSKRYLLSAAQLDPSNEKVGKHIIIKKSSLHEWLNSEKHALPEFWFERNDSGRRQQQKNEIFRLAMTEFGENIMCIPEKGKKHIENLCLDNHKELFTKDGFKRAWQELVNEKKIQSANHNICSPRAHKA